MLSTNNQQSWIIFMNNKFSIDSFRCKSCLTYPLSLQIFSGLLLKCWCEKLSDHFWTSGMSTQAKKKKIQDKTFDITKKLLFFCSVQFTSATKSCSQLFVAQWTVAHQASLSIINSQNLFNLMSIESVMPSNHLILYHPLCLLPSIFPAWGSFQMSQFFASGDQITGDSASTSVLPMSIQVGYSVGWTGWISWQSKGLLRVFSTITVWKHQFFSAQLSL